MPCICTDLESFFGLAPCHVKLSQDLPDTPQQRNPGSVTFSCALRVFAGCSPSCDELCSSYPLFDCV